MTNNDVQMINARFQALQNDLNVLYQKMGEISMQIAAVQEQMIQQNNLAVASCPYLPEEVRQDAFMKYQSTETKKAEAEANSLDHTAII